MDFTEIYKSSLATFSPGGHFLLIAVQDRLIVRRSDNFQIMRTWLPDPSPSPALPKSKSEPSDTWITHIGWSSDSEYILAACSRNGVVHVFKLRDESWTSRIDAGVEGLVKAEWAPDGRSVLCFSQWGLRVTIWSLISGTATYMQYPIHPDRGYAFRSDGRYFVLAERHKSKDTLGVYDTADAYKLVRHFTLPTTSLGSLMLSPTGNHIALWEGPLEYKVVLLTLAGNMLATFSPDPDPGFGVRSAQWHPNGHFFAVSGWENKIHILECLSWTSVATLELTTQIPSSVVTWREPSKWLESTEGRGFLSYEKLVGPQHIPLIKTQTKAHPKAGAMQLEWNKTGEMLMARFESSPTVVHIFHFPSSNDNFAPKLKTLLLHSQPVSFAQWNPVRKGSLALCCGNGGLYTWTQEWVSESGVPEEVAECVGIPTAHFETRSLRWTPDGQGIMLLDKDTICCAFEVQDE